MSVEFRRAMDFIDTAEACADLPELQTALTTGLNATGAVRVVGALARGEDALEFCVGNGAPQAILMDVALAGAMDGIGAAVAVRREFPRLPVVFYSIQDEDAYYRAFLRAGILSHYAYVRKSNYLLPEMIVPLLRDAVAGRGFVDPTIEARMQEALMHGVSFAQPGATTRILDSLETKESK